MKRKICVALLVLSGGLMMVFAAEVDKCVEKFNECKEICLNDKARCKARGNEPAYCDNRLSQCNADCNKAVKDCQTKAGTTAPAKPSPKPKK